MKVPKTDAEYGLRAAMRLIIRPIVLGQLRALRHEHPEMLTGAGIASAEKRIVNDLISRGASLRLMAVLAAHQPVAGSPEGAVGLSCGLGAQDGAPCSERSIPIAHHPA